MSNLTISIDEEILKKARMRALGEGTSVNAILRQHLERYVGMDNQYRQATDHILAIARRSKAASKGRRWMRDDAFSFWDALIVEAALQADCRVLLSEDMQDGRKIGQLLIRNPFGAIE